MKLGIRSGVIAATLVVLGACSTGTKLDNPAPVTDSSSSGNTPADASGVRTVNADSGGLDPAARALMEKSIYFDYDSYAVKDDYRSTIDANGKFLNANRARKVIVQGNTDERGGSEYNLALGQKRAEAVRKQLALVGVPENQIEAVSLGKEKPRSTGHDEAAWAENRRADFVYQAQ
ncbi:MAG: peptidoglycan-associated lipoprotein Pal [Burkholderiaceae bacterium]